MLLITARCAMNAKHGRHSRDDFISSIHRALHPRVNDCFSPPPPPLPVLFSADGNALIAKITEVDVDTNTPSYRFFIENSFPSSHTRARSPRAYHSELHSQSDRRSFRHRAVYRFAEREEAPATMSALITTEQAANLFNLHVPGRAIRLARWDQLE